MREILNFIRPPEDADWRHVNRWRWNVCLTLMALAMGLGWAYGPRGFAWAGDVRGEIEGVVDEKLKPIVKEQQEQRIVLDRVSRLLTEQLSTTVAAQIRLNISKRCKTTGAIEREELAREKDRLQEQYRTYKGEFYREPTCAEL